MKKRFKFLRTLASIFKVLGIFLAAISLVCGIILVVLALSNGNFWSLFGLDAATGFTTGIASGILTLVGGLLYGLVVYGFGEMIYVLISIEENTYRTSTFLEEMQKEEQ